MSNTANDLSTDASARPVLTRPDLSRKGMTRTTQSATLGVIEIGTIILVCPVLILLLHLNYDQLYVILGVMFGRDGAGQDGIDRDRMNMIGAMSLIVLGGFCFLIAGKAKGGVLVLAVIMGLAFGGVSNWSSIVFYAWSGNAEIVKETEASTLFQLNSAQATNDRGRVATARQGLNDARRAKGVFMEGAAQGNAAEQGQLYRDRMVGLDASIASALAELQAAETAASVSTGRARDTLEGGVSGALGKSLESVGAWLGMGEAEATSRSVATGTVISWAPCLIMLLIGMYLRQGDEEVGQVSGGSGGGGGRVDTAGEGGDTVRDLHPQGRGVRNTGYSARQLAAMAAHVAEAVPSKDGSVSISSIIDALRAEDGTSIGKGAAGKVQALVEDLLDARTRDAA